MEPIVFLSHRHADVNIANVVRQHVESWITPRKVFQSSAPNRGVPPGDHLTSKLRQALSDTNLLLLIYTSAAEDWSYVMWEAGLSTDPSSENTRIVVFKCGHDMPAMYQDYVSVEVTLDSIRDFVTRFHTQEGFFPAPKARSGPSDTSASTSAAKGKATARAKRAVPPKATALDPDIDPEVLETRASQLYVALKDVVPGGREDDAHLLDFLRLRLDYDARQAVEHRGDDESAILRIRQNMQVIKPRVQFGPDRAVNPSVRQFGFQQYKEGLTLEALIQSWKEAYIAAGQKGKQMGGDEWIDTLCRHLFLATKNKPFVSVSPKFRSVREGANWWFRAVVTRQREFSNGGLEFDVYLVPAKPPEGTTESS